MSQYLYYNGSYCLSDTPMFTAGNRAFKYGDSLFESIVLFNGNIPFLSLHWERWTKTAQILQIQVPEDFTPTKLKEICADLAELNGQATSARIRLTIFRQDGGLFLPDDNTGVIIVTLHPIENTHFVLNQKGVNLVVYPQPLVASLFLSNLKTGNAIPYIIAAQFAKANQADNCLLLNTNMEIAEAANANVFWVKKDQVHTPPLDSGCLNGVMRKVVLQILEEIKMPVLETQLTVETLRQADEVFLTNATQGIVWVAQFEEQTYTNKQTGKILEAVNAKI